MSRTRLLHYSLLTRFPYAKMADDMMIFDGDAILTIVDAILTIVDAMVACVVEHDTLFQDETQAQRLASDIFGNHFSACLDVTPFKELDEHFKTYGDLTAVQGRIQVRVGTRKHQGFCSMDT